ncbi:MAG: DUF4440 domain-containing protein [Paracoccaceae bacterium]
MIDSPEQFPRIFAGAFGAQDATAIAALLMPQAGSLTLTGRWSDTAEAAEAAFAADFAGPLARARLVTGRVALIPLGPGAAVLHQRYVVTGATDAQGTELPRIGAILSATLTATPEGWRALSACLAPLAG